MDILRGFVAISIQYLKTFSAIGKVTWNKNVVFSHLIDFWYSIENQMSILASYIAPFVFVSVHSGNLAYFPSLREVGLRTKYGTRMH